jgi:hypothetical protein
MINSLTMLPIVNESRLQVERDDKGDDGDEVVKLMAATMGLRCKLDLNMATKCVFSLCVFLECSGCLHVL